MGPFFVLNYQFFFRNNILNVIIFDILFIDKK